jgi:hypothetical protein
MVPRLEPSRQAIRTDYEGLSVRVYKLSRTGVRLGRISTGTG